MINKSFFAAYAPAVLLGTSERNIRPAVSLEMHLYLLWV